MNQSRNKPLTLAIAAAIAATSGAPGMVFAQGAVEEIVVTARQREEAVQDVPASITVLTARDLERAGVERAADFVKPEWHDLHQAAGAGVLILAAMGLPGMNASSRIFSSACLPFSARTI